MIDDLPFIKLAVEITLKNRCSQKMDSVHMRKKDTF